MDDLMIEGEGENKCNVRSSNVKLLNYLINYLIRNKDKERYNLTLRVNRDVYRNFVDLCNRLGLLKGTSRGNLVVEAFMQFMVENFDSPRVVQTTLFYKPNIRVEQNIENIAQKLELKLVKKDLKLILESLNNKRGNMNFYLLRLKEVLPKALKIFMQTKDEELESFLKQTEKWI